MFIQRSYTATPGFPWATQIESTNNPLALWVILVVSAAESDRADPVSVSERAKAAPMRRVILRPLRLSNFCHRISLPAKRTARIAAMAGDG